MRESRAINPEQLPDLPLGSRAEWGQNRCRSALSILAPELVPASRIGLYRSGLTQTGARALRLHLTPPERREQRDMEWRWIDEQPPWPSVDRRELTSLA